MSTSRGAASTRAPEVVQPLLSPRAVEAHGRRHGQRRKQHDEPERAQQVRRHLIQHPRRPRQQREGCAGLPLPRRQGHLPRRPRQGLRKPAACAGPALCQHPCPMGVTASLSAGRVLHPTPFQRQLERAACSDCLPRLWHTSLLCDARKSTHPSSPKHASTAARHTSSLMLMSSMQMPSQAQKAWQRAHARSRKQDRPPTYHAARPRQA